MSIKKGYYSNALLVATSLIFIFGVLIAVIAELLRGPELVISLSVAFATAFGPVAIVTLFLKVGFEEALYQAAFDNFQKVCEQESQRLINIEKKINNQLQECQQHSQNLIDTTTTLSVLRRCGVVEAFERRAAAYERIKAWLRDRNNREFIFVGTSFRGLYWKKEGDPEILNLIEKRAKENPELINDPDSLFMRFIFTHPAFAYLRARAEGEERPGKFFSIREEIIRSVLMLRKRGIPERAIKFYTGTPTLFGVMTDHSMFLNPYPHKKQSYTSFGFVVEKTELEDEQFSLYSTYRTAHFAGVWRDFDNTVPWEDNRLKDLWISTLEKIVPEHFDEEVPVDLQRLLEQIK